MAHEAQRADESAEIAAQIDNQSGAVLERGQRAVQFSSEPLAIHAWEERYTQVSHSRLDGASSYARRLGHRRFRITLPWIRLWQDDGHVSRRAIGTLDRDLCIGAEREWRKVRRRNGPTVYT
jgi:hypothetical protein